MGNKGSSSRGRRYSQESSSSFDSFPHPHISEPIHVQHIAHMEPSNYRRHSAEFADLTKLQEKHGQKHHHHLSPPVHF